MGFHIFDAAAGFKQLRLVHKRDRAVFIAVRTEKALKRFGKFVCVDDELANPELDQMIERKRYQRLLKNGN